MPRKGENIRKRKDGRWEGRYKNGINTNGTAHYSSVYGKSYMEVKNKLFSAKQLTQSNSKPSCTGYKFSQILQLWLASNYIRLKGATVSKYQFMIEKHIVPEFGNLKAEKITSTIINEFLNKKLKNGRFDGKGGLSPSYVKTMAIIIESALKFAEAENLCFPLHLSILKPIIVKNKLHILSGEFQQKFENFILTDLNETKLGIFIAMHTGMRIGEICALAWNDIDFSEQVIHVRHTITRVNCNNISKQKTELILDVPKTKASMRDIPISSVLLPVLVLMKKQAKSNFVVSSVSGFIGTRTFGYRYKKILSEFNMPQINFHILRHTFATRCVEMGVDIKSLSEILGHSSVAFTLNTYVHSSMQFKRIQIEKLYSASA